MAVDIKEGASPDMAWHALGAEQVLRDLKVHEEGLTTVEAEKRIEHYGPNQLREAPRPGFLAMLWDQLNNFVVILLIVASVISALLVGTAVPVSGLHPVTNMRTTRTVA